jgi:hypothetical protein
MCLLLWGLFFRSGAAGSAARALRRSCHRRTLRLCTKEDRCSSMRTCGVAAAVRAASLSVVVSC